MQRITTHIAFESSSFRETLFLSASTPLHVTVSQETVYNELHSQKLIYRPHIDVNRPAIRAMSYLRQSQGRHKGLYSKRSIGASNQSLA
ncbi:hypothetical protein EG68_01234 [Paragonimus skrjabini miyazakii]|uniref:Uncharacterized protein n=1 Tax=Paragonimus skrjabini miyazakii TaxID=59628 RepID=A0A8S9Z793_9TREM|nr:hypothetical protein EG68_01234 [Paragonimus skrjabini miyazakii]